MIELGVPAGRGRGGAVLLLLGAGRKGRGRVVQFLSKVSKAGRGRVVSWMDWMDVGGGGGGGLEEPAIAMYCTVVEYVVEKKGSGVTVTDCEWRWWPTACPSSSSSTSSLASLALLLSFVPLFSCSFPRTIYLLTTV